MPFIPLTILAMFGGPGGGEGEPGTVADILPRGRASAGGEGGKGGGTGGMIGGDGGEGGAYKGVNWQMLA